MIHNQIVICKDKEAVGKAAAEHYIALMNTKPSCVLGLATGSTPIPLYKELVALNKTGKIDFSKVHTVNLDEYKRSITFRRLYVSLSNGHGCFVFTFGGII